MTAPTRDQQVKQVCEGLALGVLALGIGSVAASKLDVEFALSHCMRNWSFAERFPSVSGHHGSSHLWIGLRRSERRRQPLAAWSDGQWLTPYVTRQGWSVRDCTEVLAERAGIPHPGWVELGILFVEHLGDGKTSMTNRSG